MGINKETIVNRFSKVVQTYDADAFAQKSIASRLDELVTGYLGNHSSLSVLEIGCGTGLFTRMLREHLDINLLHLNDISGAFASSFEGLEKEYDYCFKTGDAEQIDFAGPYNLIVSSSVFQWFEDLPAFFKKIRNSLAKGGVIAFSTFGRENLKEVKAVTGKGLSYYSKENMEELLSSYFEIVHSEENYICLQLDSPVRVLQHLKRTGVNALKSQSLWTPSRMKEFELRYKERFSIENKVQLTYHPLYFIVRNPI
jgi:malonyl-ACP O-methyltransferase BioC